MTPSNNTTTTTTTTTTTNEDDDEVQQLRLQLATAKKQLAEKCCKLKLFHKQAHTLKKELSEKDEKIAELGIKLEATRARERKFRTTMMVQGCDKLVAYQDELKVMKQEMAEKDKQIAELKVERDATEEDSKYDDSIPASVDNNATEDSTSIHGDPIKDKEVRLKFARIPSYLHDIRDAASAMEKELHDAKNFAASYKKHLKKELRNAKNLAATYKNQLEELGVTPVGCNDGILVGNVEATVAGDDIPTATIDDTIHEVSNNDTDPSTGKEENHYAVTKREEDDGDKSTGDGKNDNDSGDGDSSTSSEDWSLVSENRGHSMSADNH